MTTRQGTSFNNMANSNEDPTSDLTQQMTHLINLVTTMGNRLAALEQGQPSRVQAIIPNDQQDHTGRKTNRDDRVLRNVKVDAPSFDGTLDPIKFLDWLSKMEDYFEWYGLEDERRVGLAKIKLLGQARTY